MCRLHFQHDTLSVTQTEKCCQTPLVFLAITCSHAQILTTPKLKLMVTCIGIGYSCATDTDTI